jgi:hypothetical protein
MVLGSGLNHTIKEAVLSVVLSKAWTLLLSRAVGQRRAAIILVSHSTLRTRFRLEVLSELTSVLLVGIKLSLSLSRSRGTRWGSLLGFEVWVGHGWRTVRVGS